MSDIQMNEIAKTRQVPDTIDVLAPADGFILARNISAGQHFEQAVEFYRIADLSQVWVLTDVDAQDAIRLHAGGFAKILLPGEGSSLTARITEDILPSGGGGKMKVRLVAANPGFRLRPEMLVDVEFQEHLPPALTAPQDAVVDSGTRARVYVERADGTFEPREVETGWRFGDDVEIRRGLRPGERIVASATFLIDSESRLKALSSPPSPPPRLPPPDPNPARHKRPRTRVVVCPSIETAPSAPGTPLPIAARLTISVPATVSISSSNVMASTSENGPDMKRSRAMRRVDAAMRNPTSIIRDLQRAAASLRLRMRTRPARESRCLAGSLVALAFCGVQASGQNSPTASLVQPVADAAPHISTPPLPVAAPGATTEKAPALSTGISYKDGQLAIDTLDMTLADVLRRVAAIAGVTMEIPPEASAQRISSLKVGPGPARQVLSSLLSDSEFDYVVQGTDSNPEKIKTIVLLPRQKKPAGGNGTNAAASPRSLYSRSAPPPPVEEPPSPEPPAPAQTPSAENPDPAAPQTGSAPPPPPARAAPADPANSLRPAPLSPPASLTGPMINQQLQQMYEQRMQMMQQEKQTGSQLPVGNSQHK
jgi:hypothetical protein